MNSHPERLLFVTGKLAENALRQVLEEIAAKQPLKAEVVVLNINVAALMHVRWVAGKLQIPAGIDRVILPGWCQGNLQELEERFQVRFERGPKDVRDLPRFFSQQSREPVDLEQYDVQILAEINHAPRLPTVELLQIANQYRQDGANLIDYGCIAGEASSITGEHVRALVAEGFRVSIDSFQQDEVEAAVAAGAELVLSCNSINVGWLCQLPVETVVIPDDFQNLQTMQPVIDQLQQAGRQFRLDPILEPVGYGFFRSLERYAETRKRWPELPIMMGIGNVTELSEVDSAGVNFLLIAICQELGIHSVLTTQVINWARSSVREIDISRRLLKHAIEQQRLPKHVDSRLVQLRDPYVNFIDETELEELASQLKDPNFRIFYSAAGLHLMNRTGHWRGDDPFQLMDEALERNAIDPAHAFYLGYELAQAETARLLSKRYVQDEPLTWGENSVSRTSARDRHEYRRQQSDTGETGE